MEETTSVFEWIANLSPWWWIAFGIGLGAVEMATMSFFLIWPALAAVMMAGILAFAGPMSGEMIVSVWAILSIVLTFIGRSLLHRFGDGGEMMETLNNRSQRLVGRTAKVIDWAGNEGAVEVAGTRWRAVSSDGNAPAQGTVVIEKADGMLLTVRSE